MCVCARASEGQRKRFDLEAEDVVSLAIEQQRLQLDEFIGGCRAQKEPGHGGLSAYETFILWLKFNSLSHFLNHGSKVYPGIALVCPGLQPPNSMWTISVSGSHSTS